MVDRSGATLLDAAQLGPVHLSVTNMSRVLPTWRNVAGLEVLGEDDKTTTLGIGALALVVLHETALEPMTEKAVGLFHVAFSVPTRKHLAEAALRARRAGHPHSAQDHVVSESLYFSDPDGLGIEIYLPTPHRGSFAIVDGRPKMVTPDGQTRSGLDPLDIDVLLRETETEAGGEALPRGTRVGHVHMRSNAPEAAMEFYQNVIGMRPHIQSAAMGMFDCGTAETPHLVAFNTWGGRALPERSASRAGLISFTIEAPAIHLAKVKEAAARIGLPFVTDGQELHLQDKDGNGVVLKADVNIPVGA